MDNNYDSPDLIERPIQISVDLDDKGNAEFTYMPAVKRVCAGDLLQWTFRGGPFAIQFKEAGTPANAIDARGVPSRDDNALFLNQPLQVRPDASGHFHYGVAVVLEGKVYLDAACPEIIAN